MTIHDRAQLLLQAETTLQNAKSQPKKLTAFHTAVTVGVALVLSLLGVLLHAGVMDTQGLSGIQTRSLLQTVESVLNLAYSIGTMFWPVGLVFAFMQISRGKNADRRTLCRGFHRWGPVLRLSILKYLLFVVLAIPCAYVSSSIAMVFSSHMVEVLEPVVLALQEDPTADPVELVMALPIKELLWAMAPMLLIFTVLYLGFAVFLGYRLRFATYCIVDDPQMGAIAAMKTSMHMTRDKIKALFLLDLRFWLYYLIRFAVSILGLVDLILNAAGVSLPISNQLAGFVCYCLYAALILWIDYTMRPKVETTYALAYDSLQ